MLVLTRKNKESVFIKVKNSDGTEETIKIQVVGTGKLVRLGIEAPKKFPIYREELLTQPAATTTPTLGATTVLAEPEPAKAEPTLAV